MCIMLFDCHSLSFLSPIQSPQPSLSLSLFAFHSPQFNFLLLIDAATRLASPRLHLPPPHTRPHTHRLGKRNATPPPPSHTFSRLSITFQPFSDPLKFNPTQLFLDTDKKRLTNNTPPPPHTTFRFYITTHTTSSTQYQYRNPRDH